jgi:hypothetical protein
MDALKHGARIQQHAIPMGSIRNAILLAKLPPTPGLADGEILDDRNRRARVMPKWNYVRPVRMFITGRSPLFLLKDSEISLCSGINMEDFGTWPDSGVLKFANI